MTQAWLMMLMMVTMEFLLCFKLITYIASFKHHHKSMLKVLLLFQDSEVTKVNSSHMVSLLYLFQSPLSGWYPSHTITVPSFSPSVVRIQHNSRQYKSFKDDPACFYPTVFSSSSPWLCFSQSEMELFGTR
ncbi:uncharacterized protein LOC144283320 isoform X4 [Canis aureus]